MPRALRLDVCVLYAAMMALYARTLTAAFVASIVSMTIPSAAEPAAAEDGPATDPVRGSCIPAEKCCRVCSAGKACGKSCIQATKQCHKGRGCACNESEVCESERP